MDSRTEKLKSCLADFREMPEARMLIDYRSRESRLSFDDRMAVIRCLEKAFAPVFLEMRVESPSLSESDLIYCALIAAGFKSEVIADCISISKESLRMRKIRVKEKLSPFWAGVLFPESDATKSCDNVAQQNSSADNATILLRQNQSNSKVMETKKITFGAAIKSGFKNCFNFSGRTSRTEFWYFVLFYVLVFYTLGYAIAFSVPFIMLKHQHPITMESALLICGFLFLILIIPLISLTVRRLHDTERKGIWIMTYLAPIFLILALTIYSMLFIPMTEKTETETVSYTNLAEHYNRYTDSNGDTIRIYPDYMSEVLSGKKWFFYYTANGDSIVIDPSIFNTADDRISTSDVNKEQKLMYGTVGIVSFLVIFSIIGFALLIIFCAMPGTEGPNSYGPDPSAKV